MHVDEKDYISMLYNLGRECIGAVRITAEKDISEEKYIPVTESEIKQLAAEGATKSTEIITKTHLSLTGASVKVGLYYDQDSGKWYLPPRDGSQHTYSKTESCETFRDSS